DREVVQEITRRVGRLHPRRRIERASQQFDDLLRDLDRAARSRLRANGIRCGSMAGRFVPVRVRQVAERYKQRVQSSIPRLPRTARKQLEARARLLGQLTMRLRLLSPQNVLDRGFSLTTRTDTGEIVRDSRKLKVGTQLRTRFKAGQATSRVEESSRS